MRVVISKNHLRLNNKLASELNRLAEKFNTKSYSKIGNIDIWLAAQDISVEKKKSFVLKQLHNLALQTFSINKKRFGNKALPAFRERLDSLRRLVGKLRSINYYLETVFLDEMGISGTRIQFQRARLIKVQLLAKGEFEALEYAAYKLIGKAAVLDKRLLREYSRKEAKIIEHEKTELNDLGILLSKQSELLEHLEAKIPPAKAAAISLVKEPVFSNWTSRIFALLAYLEHLYTKEKEIFKQLKKNKKISIRINKKINYLIRERSKLLSIMEQKSALMKKFDVDAKLKKEFQKLAATVNA